MCGPGTGTRPGRKIRRRLSQLLLTASWKNVLLCRTLGVLQSHSIFFNGLKMFPNQICLLHALNFNWDVTPQQSLKEIVNSRLYNWHPKIPDYLLLQIMLTLQCNNSSIKEIQLTKFVKFTTTTPVNYNYNYIILWTPNFFLTFHILYILVRCFNSLIVNDKAHTHIDAKHKEADPVTCKFPLWVMWILWSILHGDKLYVDRFIEEGEQFLLFSGYE